MISGRRRHQLRRIFPVVASIYMAFTAVLIPLIFQFMAMMGGKAFIIGKIALLFSLFTSFNKFISGSNELSQPSPPYPSHINHAPSIYYPLPPPPLPPPPHPPQPPSLPYEQPLKRKSDKFYDYTTRIPMPINYTYYTIE